MGLVGLAGGHVRSLPKFRTYYCATLIAQCTVRNMTSYRDLSRNRDFTIGAQVDLPDGRLPAVPEQAGT